MGLGVIGGVMHTLKYSAEAFACAPQPLMQPLQKFYAEDPSAPAISRLATQIDTFAGRVKDALAKNPDPIHPLTMHSSRYEQVIIPVKLLMAVARHCLQTMPLLYATTLFACGVCLTRFGIAYDKYAPQQVAKGRGYEPNNICTAIDAAMTWHFAGQVVAVAAAGQTWWLWLWSLSTIPVACSVYTYRNSRSGAKGNLKEKPQCEGDLMTEPLLH